jgi:predicted amidophosphoribosyltransferase
MTDRSTLTPQHRAQWWTYRMRLRICPSCTNNLVAAGAAVCDDCAAAWNHAHEAPPVTTDLDTAVRQAGIDPAIAAEYLQSG